MSEVAAGPEQMRRAELLHRLHAGPDLLVLTNVWDAGSAALISRVPGVRALATTSAGVAAAHGFRDGELLGLDRLRAAVAEITAVSSLPLTVDLEAGYGDTAEDVAASVSAMLAAGAVGMNLEDGLPGGARELRPTGAHVERVAAARTAADRAGVPAVVNARSDAYWHGVGSPEQRFAETVSRLRAYVEAGAHCVFVPGFPGPNLSPQQARDQVAALVDALAGTPVNLLAGPGVPEPAELAELGVRRLTVGGTLYRLAMAAAVRAAGELLESGRLAALAPAAALTYPQLQEALADMPAERGPA